MRKDFIQDSLAVVMNSWIDYAETQAGTPYTGERFIQGVDWNLQLGGKRYNDFLAYLDQAGQSLTNTYPVNEQSDWSQEVIWTRLYPQIPDEVFSEFFGDRDYNGTILEWKDQFAW